VVFKTDDSVVFVFNEYKTAKIYGTRVIVVPQDTAIYIAVLNLMS